MESSTTSFNDIAVEHTRNSADMILKSFAATPEDKRFWQPLDKGRHIVGQLLECASANFYFAEYLRNFAAPAEYVDQTADTEEEALKLFNQSVDDILSSIKGFPEDRLGELIQSATPKPYRWLMLFLARHMYYHWGQINYIQTLYGDTVHH